MGEKTDFLAGLVVGTLVGLGLGMMFAPQSGQQTREKLRGKADEMGERLRGTAQDVTERVRESTGDLASKMRETLDDKTQRLRGAYERGRETMQQKRDDILGKLGESEDA